MSTRHANELGLPLAFVALFVAVAWVPLQAMSIVLLPILFAGAMLIAWRSFRLGVVSVVFLALLVDNPQYRPMEGEWRSPLYPAGEILYTNLHQIVGIDALRFSFLEVLLLGLVLVALIHRAGSGGSSRLVPLSRGGRLIAKGLLVAFVAVFVLEAWGLARGGDFRQSLWQLRQIFWLPVLAWLCMHALRRREDLWLLTGAVMVAGVLRAFTGFAYYGISRAEGHVPTYVTTHADSVLWIVGVMTCLLMLLERPGRRAATLSFAFLPIASAALILNDRRLAFVVLAAAFIVMAMVFRRTVWRRIGRVALLASPLLAIYVAVGWQVEHRAFAPIHTFRSLTDESDASNHSRDVENFNLIYTLLESPVVGSGFGHSYSEHLYTYRIDHVFEQYLFMPHNSVLWLLAVGGIAGFLALWGFLPLVVWLAGRCYGFSRGHTERIGALISIAVVTAYLVQSWGDIGVHSWLVTIILAAYVGLAGNLDRHVEAWGRRRSSEGSRRRVASAA